MLSLMESLQVVGPMMARAVARAGVEVETWLEPSILLAAKAFRTDHAIVQT